MAREPFMITIREVQQWIDLILPTMGKEMRPVSCSLLEFLKGNRKGDAVTVNHSSYTQRSNFVIDQSLME